MSYDGIRFGLDIGSIIMRILWQRSWTDPEVEKI